MSYFAWLFLVIWLQDVATTSVNVVQLPLRTVEMLTLAANDSVHLTLDQIPGPGDAFWTFEAHSQDNNDILRFRQGSVQKKRFQVENHPGMIYFRESLPENHTKPEVILDNLSHRDVTLVLVARNYSAKHPVPGLASNSTQGNALNLTYDGDVVTLDFSLGKALNSSGGESGPILTYSIYQHYLTERDYDQDRFLSELSTSMLQLDDIIDNGQLVDPAFISKSRESKSKIVFSSYPGTAVIFSVIVTTTYQNANDTKAQVFSSLYATTSTYGCQFDKNKVLSCQTIWATITKILCGCSIFAGIFIAFFGHRYYQAYQFIAGAYATGICAFIAITLAMQSSYTEKVGLAMAVGVIGAFLWVIIWYLFGIPLLSTALPVASMGLIIGATFVFLPPLNTASMASDTLYWLTIAAFIVGCLLAVLPFTKTASMLSAVILGSFLCIIPLDHYIGSSLKYILVNLIRRSNVTGFNLAVLYFPFQINDIALACGWIAFVVVAFTMQYLREKGRAPFPPNPYQLRRWRQEERSFISQNAINDAEEETQPLIVPELDNRPMSPTSRSPRRGELSSSSAAAGPVVGYIRRNNYGSNANNISASPSVIRTLESPSLYNAQPCAVAPPASPRKFWGRRQQDDLQQMSTSVEARDFFRPPPGHPSQK